MTGYGSKSIFSKRLEIYIKVVYSSSIPNHKFRLHYLFWRVKLIFKILEMLKVSFHLSALLIDLQKSSLESNWKFTRTAPHPFRSFDITLRLPWLQRKIDLLSLYILVNDKIPSNNVILKLMHYLHLFFLLR